MSKYCLSHRILSIEDVIYIIRHNGFLARRNKDGSFKVYHAGWISGWTIKFIMNEIEWQRLYFVYNTKES